jgi:hypothetical protein
MKIDLHVHTRERSPCACSSTDEMILAAVDRGLDGLVITDHDRLVPTEDLAYLNAKYAPFRVFGGIEVTTRGEHVLVLGVQDEALRIGGGPIPISMPSFRRGKVSSPWLIRFASTEVGLRLTLSAFPRMHWRSTRSTRRGGQRGASGR